MEDVNHIKAWNSYFDSYGREPATGTQFQRFCSDNFKNIGYSKAFDIYNKYTGKGKIPFPNVQTQQNTSNPPNGVNRKRRSYSWGAHKQLKQMQHTNQMQQNHHNNHYHPQHSNNYHQHNQHNQHYQHQYNPNYNNNRPQSSRVASNRQPQQFWSNAQNWTAPQWNGNYFAQNTFNQPVANNNNNNNHNNNNMMNHNGNAMIQQQQQQQPGAPQSRSLQQLHQQQQQQQPQLQHNPAMRFASPPPPKSKPLPQRPLQRAKSPPPPPPNRNMHNGYNANNAAQQEKKRRQPKSMKGRKRRSNTVIAANDLHVSLPAATQIIRTYSVSPKVAEDDLPKDPFTQFLIDHDIRDLKRKLQENHIELRHLQILEPADFNALCNDLKLSTPEKIRFKCAVKELQQKGSNPPIQLQTRPSSRSFHSHQSLHSNNSHHSNHTNHSNNNYPHSHHSAANSGPAAAYHHQPQRQQQHHQQQQLRKIQLTRIHSDPQAMYHPSSTANNFGLMQSESVNFQLSPAVAAMDDDYEAKLGGLPNANLNNNNHHLVQLSHHSNGSSQSLHQKNMTISRPLPNLPESPMVAPISANAPRLSHIPELPAFTPHHSRERTARWNQNNSNNNQGDKNDDDDDDDEDDDGGGNHRNFVPPSPPTWPSQQSSNKSVDDSEIDFVPPAPPQQRFFKKKRSRRRSIGAVGTPTASSNGSRVGFGHHAWMQWHNQWKTLIKGTATNRTEISVQSAMSCISLQIPVDRCCCVQRIVYLMRFYLQFKNKGTELKEIIKAISSHQYNIIDLLNDHYHIQDFHKPNDAEFKYIFEQINVGNLKTGCRIDQCEMNKRNHASSESESIALYHGLNDMDDIIYIQILDKIHCSLLHCYDLFRFSPQENQQLQAVVENNRNKHDLLLHNEYYKRVSQLMQVKNHNLRQVKGKRNTSNKYSTLSDDVSAKRNEFGIKYIYDGSHGHNVDNQFQRNVSARYNNLKEELLNNQSINISHRDWNLCLRKCERYYFFTNKLKQFQRKIDLESMLCLSIFVNFETLQQQFKETYFGKKSKYHSNFCCFAQALSHAISTYGLLLENYHFYHGLVTNNKSNDVTLTDIYFRFNCPILTTSRFEVIHNYQNNKGIILNMSNCDIIGGNARFIDTSWFAQCESEEQQIFFDNTNILYFRIASIINLQNYSNYYYYLNAIYVLQRLMSQKPMSFQLTAEIFQSLKFLFESILKPQNRIHSGQNMVPLFKLFDKICSKQQRISVNIKQILQTFGADKFLLNFFLLQVGKQTFSLNVANLRRVFENITSISMSLQYLESTIFENLLKTVKISNCKIEHIDFNQIQFDSNNKNVYHSVDEAVSEFGHKFAEIGFEYEVISSSNTLIFAKENYSFLLTETCKISVLIFDPRRDSMMSIDYHTMRVMDDIYEFTLETDNNKQFKVNKHYQDLVDLHSFMTTKRKGVKSINFKQKLPSNSFRSGNKLNPFGNKLGSNKEADRKRQQQKVEAYFKYLLKVVLKHENEMFKRKLYSFLSSHH